MAQDYQRQGSVFGILQWDYFHSQNINTQIQAGAFYSYLDFGPQGLFSTPDYQPTDKMFSAQNSTYDPNRPLHINNDDGSLWYQGSTAQYNKRYSVQFDPSISVRGRAAGSHDAKIGLQARYVRDDYYQKTPGDKTYLDAGGGPGEAGLCNEATGNGCSAVLISPPFTQTQQGFGVGVFVQDRWKPFKRLTILPGIRFDYGFTKNTLNQTVTSLFGVGPRLGFTVDLTGESEDHFRRILRSVERNPIADSSWRCCRYLGVQPDTGLESEHA